MSSRYLDKQCPVCGYTLAKMVFDAGEKPLATIVWAESSDAAKAVDVFRQEYIQCLSCSHVWNHLFDWNHVPYGDKPNKMYNNGSQWKKHVDYLRHWLSSRIPQKPTVVDIGCGDGSFLISMSDLYCGSGDFLGFDPSGDVQPDVTSITFHRSLFSPLEDTVIYKPDLMIMRHVAEHLTAPSSFLHSLAWGASRSEKPTFLYCEVPCIDRVFETGRIADFYYEHPSQFTTLSFTRMLSTAGKVVDIHHAYDGEVICGLVELRPSPDQLQISRQADHFCALTSKSISAIRGQLSGYINRGVSIAIWGGTGKCAAFMHYYGITSEDVAIVVDSDPRKWGTFVPGVGQEIRDPEYLRENPVEVLVIPTQWRAQDILIEAMELGLEFIAVLIEHNGGLVDFRNARHPYATHKLTDGHSQG